MSATAQAERRGGIGPLGCLFIGAVLVVLAFLALAGAAEEGLPSLNGHATEKHGAAAVNAWEYVNSLAIKDFCKHNCPDGRTRYVCKINGTNDFAIVVLEGNTLITSFTADQTYAKHVLDDQCGDSGNRFAHP